MMTNKIVKVVVILAMITTLCFAFYKLGKSNAKIEIVTKEIEVIKYVEKKKANIYTKPNASRSELIKRMRNGML